MKGVANMENNNQIDGNVIHATGQNKEVKDIDVFYELLRRLDITRRARIKASTRLREKHEFYEKTSYCYSIVILVLSIWFIDSSGDITKVLLIASLSLTFYTMFLGIKNYKERASNFENNYQQLNELLNKMQRLEADKHKITQNVLKELHREYEKLIIDKENHLPIDFMMCNSENETRFKNEIKRYKRIDTAKKESILIFPFILLAIFLFTEYLK